MFDLIFELCVQELGSSNHPEAKAGLEAEEAALDAAMKDLEQELDELEELEPVGSPPLVSRDVNPMLSEDLRGCIEDEAALTAAMKELEDELKSKDLLDSPIRGHEYEVQALQVLAIPL